ncbi:phosphotransferase [Effusibacillus consociatus]|uniref:Phosphotransferase n=1 Tax=Effusibacillus consociatus TaxID=1117041 RepID=A0ABV9Q767_9BACL
MYRADVNLDRSTIKSIILRYYDLDVISLKKVRAAYKVATEHGAYGFKNAAELPDLSFIRNCTEHIKKNGFPHLPDILPTNTGESLVQYDGEIYYMEQWIDAEEVSKANAAVIGKIGIALADFHHAAKGLLPAPDSSRFGWGKRRDFLRDAYLQILNWKKQDRTVLGIGLERQMLDFLQYRCWLAHEYLKEVSYSNLLADSPEAAVLCHGSLHHKNILVGKEEEIWFIDWESMIYAERVLDLAQLLHYHAPPHAWNPSVIRRFFHGYQSRLSTPIAREEWKCFFSYLAFPRRFYTWMNRYFDTQQPTVKAYFKLKKIIDQDLGKEMFLQQFPPNRI